MVKILDRKLRRELWANRWLLLAVLGIIVVGVACFVAMGSSYNNLTEAKARYYRQCRMADFAIELKKVPQSGLESVAELPGVAEIRPRIQFFATVDLDTAPGPLNGLVLSMPDRREPVLNDIVLRRGGYFTDRRENEVIVNDAFAEAHGLSPGDWVRLVLNNRSQELYVVGTGISSEFVYMLAPGSIVPDPEHFGIFFLKQSYAEDVFDFDGAANQVLGRLAPGQTWTTREILDRAEQLLGDFGVFTTTPLEDQASNKYLSQEIEGLWSFAVFMPTIFLAVAALVLNVLLSRLAEQQRTVVGTLKALGYSDGQVFLHFFKFAMAVGLAGGLAGCALGYVLAGLMTMVYRTVFEFPELRNHFYPGLMLAAVSISLGCAAAGSLRGTRAVLRLQPAEAMRPRPPKRGGRIVLERLPALWGRLTVGWRMVLRGVVRSRLRSLAGIFAAAMGAAVLVCGFMLIDATYYLVDFQFRWLLKSDVELSFAEEQGEDALLEAARLPGVRLAEPILNVACTFENGHLRHKGSVTGLGTRATLTVPRDVGARPIRVPSAGLAMSGKLAEILGLERGEFVTLRPTKGLREPRQAAVVEISDSYLGTAVYADIEYLSRLLGEEFAMTGVQLQVEADAEQRRALDRQLKQLPAVEAVADRSSMIRSLEDTILFNMNVFIFVFVAFAGVIFFGSILNSSLVSLAERQRELATLRVLGYGPWQIGSLLLRESLVLTALGTVLGMPFGYLLTVALAMSYDSELLRFPVVSSAGTWLMTAVLAFLFTVLAYLFVQRSVHRMNWLEALQTKE
ncbi:MAG: ABC transporter permease [Thermoguttaceae bacterium]